MPAFLEITIPVLNFMIMFTVGTSLKVDDFRLVSNQPRKVVIPVIAQIVFPPLVGMTIVQLLPMEGYLMIGILLVAACPSGALSNLFVYLTRTNTALSVVLTGLSCLCAVFTMPLVLTLFEYFLETPVSFSVPIKILIFTLTVFMLLPILLGMLTRVYFSTLVEQYDCWLRIGSVVFMTVLVGQVVWQSQKQFMDVFVECFIASLVMAGLISLGGVLVAKGMQLQAYDFWPVVVELMIQNIGLAATVAVTVFQEVQLASFASIYLIVQISMASMIVFFSKGRIRKPLLFGSK